MTAPINPVMLEVVRNHLPAIANEMAIDLQRTSYNMMIYEVCDFCTAYLDIEGRLVSQNVGGVSHFVADLGAIIVDAMAKYGRAGFAEGDVLITNHQRVAGQHLNNIVVYVPFFHEEELLGFTATRAHWIDVGGMSTGFGAGPQVSDPWLEGLQIDQLKIYEAGKLNETLHSIIRDNIRYPESSMGDLRAQIASCKLGVRRLKELYRKYGRDDLDRCIGQIFAETEQRCRKVVELIPDGVYTAEAAFDDDGVALGEPVEIKVAITISGGDMTIDLSGCSSQRQGGINARTLAAARVAYKALTEPNTPVNEGSFSALLTVIPEGNVMMARHPAPMGAWSLIVPTVVDTIFRALAPVMPRTIPAAHHGLLGGSVIFFGKAGGGEKFFVQSLEGGGWGGHFDRDGQSGSVSICQGNVKNAPIEAIEMKNPVVVERRALRIDSGGAGTNRGGLGISVRVRNLQRGKWNLSRPRRMGCPPWGLNGGGVGESARLLLRTGGEGEFKGVDAVMHEVPVDSVAEICTGGGGGWGSPLERPVDAVVADILDEFITIEAAEKLYGVVLMANGTEADMQATASLRKRLAAA